MEHTTKGWMVVTALVLFSITVGAQLDHSEYDSFTFTEFGAGVIDLVLGWAADILESWWILLLALTAFVLLFGLLLIVLYMTGVLQ